MRGAADDAGDATAFARCAGKPSCRGPAPTPHAAPKRHLDGFRVRLASGKVSIQVQLADPAQLPLPMSTGLFRARAILLPWRSASRERAGGCPLREVLPPCMENWQLARRVGGLERHCWNARSPSKLPDPPWSVLLCRPKRKKLQGPCANPACCAESSPHWLSGVQCCCRRLRRSASNCRLRVSPPWLVVQHQRGAACRAQFAAGATSMHGE